MYCNRSCLWACLFVCGGTKVYRVVDNRLDGTQLQIDLDVLGDWTVKRQMNFNVEKCKFVHYGKIIEFEYSLYGHPLEAVASEKKIYELSSRMT